MARTTKSKEIHNNLISAMVKFLISKGYNVKVDHIDGYENNRPDEYGGKIPDIVATKNGDKIFVEAETCDTISSIESKEQWEVFANNLNFKFFMIVPKECVEELKKQLDKWKIAVDSIYVF